ncbi:MAG TPA: hypothetical protein VFX89_01795 [Gammaproteobacteria bacterium]|nr:hypothetical protein [Gammaproteobacteria bacterium]
MRSTKCNSLFRSSRSKTASTSTRRRGSRRLLLLCALAAQPAFGAELLEECFGDRLPMTVAQSMPYVVATIGEASGYFLIDHGSNYSTIDAAAFAGPAPRPNAGTLDRFDGFRFFGSWGTVRLTPASHAGIDGLPFRQAGIIGTDFLSTAAFTIDYAGGGLYRASAARFCSGERLRASGFVATSTAGYFANDSQPRAPAPRQLPAVPIRLGQVAGLGILDPGFADTAFRHSIVINEAYFRELRGALVRRGLDVLVIRTAVLSACVPPVRETALMLKLPPSQRFEVVAEDGTSAASADDVLIYARPDGASGCSSIGAADAPLALVGSSFLIDAGRVAFDPFSQHVWLQVEK